MFNQFQKRPQSRSYKTKGAQLRPITRRDNTEQGEKCFKMGKQHHSRNQLQQAERFYIQATVHNPLHYKAYSNLGLCYKLQGRYNQSIGCYKKALSLNPSDQITHYNMGNAYRVVGNYEKSIQHYQQVIELKIKQQQQIKQGVKLSSRYVDNEKSSYQQLTSQPITTTISTLYLDAYNNLGVCYKLTESYRNAVECFQIVLKNKPEDNQVMFNLAVSKLKMVRKMVKDTSQLESFALLVGEIIAQTKMVFEKVIECDSVNEVAKLGLIELQCYANLNNLTVLQKAILQLNSIIINSSQQSSFIVSEANQLKTYCSSVIYKLKQQQQQLELQRLKRQRQQQKAKSIIDHDKQIVNIRLEQQQKVKNQQGKVELTSQQQQNIRKIQQQQSEKISSKPQQPLTSMSSSSMRNTQRPKSSQIINITEQQFSNLWLTVQRVLISDTNLNNRQVVTTEVVDIIDNAISQALSKHFTLSTNKAAATRVSAELEILGYAFIGERQLHDGKMYFKQAFESYLRQILCGDMNTLVTRQLMHLPTHRVMASILTALGYSQKAIQHYQIISLQLQQSQSSQKHNDSSNTAKQQLHSGLAVNYQSQGYYQKAILQFGKAIAISPQNYTLYYNMAYCQHCEHKNQQAIINYSKFLQQLQRDIQIGEKEKLSYQLQAKISIFLCENEGQVQKKVAMCGEIISMIESMTQPIGQYVDDETLLKFYLPACDLFEQLIYSSHATRQHQQVKHNKQQLFKLYMNLLNIPHCPDRGEILINCGNLLFQERQYLNALAFYQKAQKYQEQQQLYKDRNQKVDIWNLLGIAFLHVNEYERALQCVSYACEHECENPVYNVNVQLMRWAFGIQCNMTVNKLAQMFSCRCDTQFTTRVQLIKSVILLLTNYLQQSTSINSKQSLQAMTVQQLFGAMFDSNNNSNKKNKSSYWKQPQEGVRYDVLLGIMKRHCEKGCYNVQKNIIADTINSLTRLIQQSPAKSYNELKSIFLQLKQQLSSNTIKTYPNYLHLLSQTLSYFLYYHTIILKDNQPLINKLFTQELYPTLSTSPPIQITFPNDVIQQHPVLYPLKSFTVLYPQIQLKSQNLIQSLYNWQLKLQDQFVYLIKIIQSIAYKNGVDQSVGIEYNFPYCKNVESCGKCLEKAVNVFWRMFERKERKQMIEKQQQEQSLKLEERKKAIARGFITTFPTEISNFLTKAQESPDQNILTLSLSQTNLPISISLHFPSQPAFKVFLTEFCKQLSIPKITYSSSNQSLTIVMNKLISFKCEWKEDDFISEFVQNMRVSKLNIKETAILWLQQEGINCE